MYDKLPAIHIAMTDLAIRQGSLGIFTGMCLLLLSQARRLIASAI